MNSGGMTIDSLLLPESHEGVLQNEVDEQDKQPSQTEQQHLITIHDLIRQQGSLTSSFYSDICATEATEMQQNIPLGGKRPAPITENIDGSPA